MPEEYWNLFARLAGPQPPEFEAKLFKKNGDAIRPSSEDESKAILADLDRASWIVSSVTTKERKRHAPAPFITSKLQQTARFPVKKTMMLAQQLYEGIELPGLGVDGAVGLITYMRTDSVRVADEAIDEVRAHITSAFGGDYLPEQANVYKTKSDAQDAHEAIRPTSMQYDPETVRPFLTQGSVFALPPDLEPLRRLADDAGHLRRDDGGRDARRATICSASRGRCRSSPAGWRPTVKPNKRRSSATAARERRQARAPRQAIPERESLRSSARSWSELGVGPRRARNGRC